jgi:hypothetical protein
MRVVGVRELPNDRQTKLYRFALFQYPRRQHFSEPCWSSSPNDFRPIPVHAVCKLLVHGVEFMRGGEHCRRFSARRSRSRHSRCTVASRTAEVACAILDRRRRCPGDTLPRRCGLNARIQLRSRRTATRKSCSAFALSPSSVGSPCDARNPPAHACRASAISDRPINCTPRSVDSRSRSSSNMCVIRNGRCSNRHLVAPGRT